MPSFTVHERCGIARCGRLSLGDAAELATPAVLGLTQRGAPLNLTHDTHASLPASARLLGLCALSFAAEAPTLAALHACGGAHGYLGLADCTLFASCREPGAFDGGGRASDAGLLVSTQSGHRRLAPAAFADVLLALRCDAAACLADEVAASEGAKRQRAAVDRTLRWHRETVAALQRRGGAAADAALASLGAVVGGGEDEEQRRRAAAEAAALLPPPAGFSLAGFGTGEPPSERPRLLRAATHSLSPASPVHVSGLHSPDEVLAAVGCGVDLFDGAYAHDATRAGCALIFPQSEQDVHVSSLPLAGDGSTPVGDGFKVNLRAECFSRDARPLLPGCACFACARHSRAYLHHLLACHEMLGDVLLDLHNQYHMLRFFERIREAIRDGGFQRLAAWHGERAQAVREAAAEAALGDGA